VDAWKEEGLSRDLIGHSSGWWSDGCGRAMRSGGGGELSSDEYEFLRKRNPKEGGEWMRQQNCEAPDHFKREKEHARRLLVPTRTGGRKTQRHGGGRSLAASRLNRDGRQLVRPVRPKGYLGRILLWRSNRLLKWNGLGKRDSCAERKLWRRI
jgi:hypothetical protein